jgi:hypothetical protein
MEKQNTKARTAMLGATKKTTRIASPRSPGLWNFPKIKSSAAAPRDASVMATTAEAISTAGVASQTGILRYVLWILITELM